MLDVRREVEKYFHQHAYLAGIHVDVDTNTCRKVLELLTQTFLLANKDIELFISNEILSESTPKQSQRSKSWKRRLRKAVAAYCSALYDEFDLKDVFLMAVTANALTEKARLVDCVLVINNSDCIRNAVPRARVIVQERKLPGFNWFLVAA